MKKQSKGRFLIVALACIVFFAMATVASAAVDSVRCILWQGDTAKFHTAIDGQSIRLKGVITTTDTSIIWYKWVFGDGSESAVTSLSGSTKYNVNADHVYTGAVGTPFTAQLQVDDVDSSMANAVTDNYLLKIEENNLDARVNIAIDNGLWYLYKTQIQGSYSAGTYGPDPVNYGYWNNSGAGSYAGYYQGPTSSAIQAFEINSHLQSGDPDENPYVKTVERGFNFIFANTYVQSIGVQAGGHPEDYDNDGSGDGNGIAISGTRSRPIYELGQIMDAIVASGTPTETARTGPANVIGRTYEAILQDMVDMYAWGQDDSGSDRGGWRYSWNNDSDNSAAQWAAIGIIPSEDLWGLKTPDWVKTLNNVWLTNSYDGVGFGYTGAGHTYARTASGMVQLSFCDLDTTDPRWTTSENYLASNWNGLLSAEEYYDFYAFAKAMRLALPAPISNLSNGIDWYRGGGSTKGLAEKIVEMQQSAGSWPNKGWPYVGTSLRTAWCVIILRPALFKAAPIACFTAHPNPTYADMDIIFDPSCSDHSETGKDITNLTSFEWDWNNDGVYDESTAGPAEVTHSFPCTTLPGAPCTYPVTLKVTDDDPEALTATYTLNIRITNPPHPPVADANGPYMVSLCDGDSLTLDGTGSFDPNEGQHEAGCSTCPDDTIIAWNWDLTSPLTGFDDESGDTVVLDSSAIASYFGAGSHNIGLQVTDNTEASYPSSGESNYTDADFATVRVYDACACDLAARPKSSKVQLTWTHTGADSYDIYRSTEGPNTGFALIADDHVTTYATYLDYDVVNGTTYYYRVVSSDGCGSTAVSAIPQARTRR